MCMLLDWRLEPLLRIAEFGRMSEGSRELGVCVFVIYFPLLAAHVYVSLVQVSTIVSALHGHGDPTMLCALVGREHQ